ncbi:MAG: aspartate kinase [Spirochaetia bacterium]
MIVLKFGGTSVGTFEKIDNVISIAENQLQKAPVLVASAMAKTTDSLERAKTIAGQGNTEEAVTVIESEAIKAETLEILEEHFVQLISFVKGISLLRECTTRSSDAVLSFGEILSTTIIAARAKDRGIQVDFFDSRKLIKTDEDFTKANVLFEETGKAIRERLKPKKGLLCIGQGFIASTLSGVTSTLGRGGSDYTAAILGSALKAEEVQIWTDVDGIMTTDPRIVKDARTILELSYDEAAELAYFGAKVVHPSTIQPAVAESIPVYVKNTGNPEFPGTRISERTESLGVRALAGKKDVTVVTINSTRMLNAYGFLSRIFSIFEKHRTPVDLIATSEVSVSMTIDIDTNLDTILLELEGIGNVTVEKDQAIVCLVGHQLWRNSSVIAKVFDTLSDIPVRLISLGSSDTNLSIVVSKELLHTSLEKLHPLCL